MPAAVVHAPRFSPANLTFWTARAALLLWAGFWMWFNVASVPGDKGGAWYHIGFGVITVGLGLTAWFRPRLGGVLMIAAGMAAAWWLHGGAAYTMLALPAVAIGVLLLLSRPAR